MLFLKCQKPTSLQSQKRQYLYLISLMADTLINRPRRPRINDRVVKVKMSKFKRKTSQHKIQREEF